MLIALAHVINLKVASGKRLLKVISSSIKAQGTSADANGVRYKLVHLLARLADCPHNKQVMVEQTYYIWRFDNPILRRYSCIRNCILRKSVSKRNFIKLKILK